MSEVQKPVGIMGGTFDPIHNAHLRLAEDACDLLGLASVVIIPAGTPPHRQTPVAAAAHRLAMARLAVSGKPMLRVDDAEMTNAEPAYTVPTLEGMRRKYGDALVLLLGADAFLDLANWHRWRELFGLAHIAVATRPGHALDAAALPAALNEECGRRLQSDPACLTWAPAGCVVPFAMTPMDISATTIRAALARGEKPRGLLPPQVLDYIVLNQLYQSPA